MDLQPGSRLGRYEIVEALGAGGMGLVYKARDTRLDRTVAVKLLATEVAADPQSRLRFEREARAISRLNHPHICTLFDVGNVDGTEFLVMEHLEGVTLANRLDRGRLSRSEALTFSIQILQALDAAHEHGIVHRDLKPANVMLTPSGVKLLDFGLAKFRDSGKVSAFLDDRLERGRDGSANDASDAPTQEQPITSAGAILGTFQYMAPEQIEGRDADARTDIFAFGALLYEMATGRRAFRASSNARLIGEILVADPRPMRDVDTTVPPALEALVARCLAKAPDDRWQHARDVRWQLENLPDETAEVDGRRFPARLGVHLAWAAATLAVAVLTVIAVRNGDGVPTTAAGTVEAVVNLPAERPLNPTSNPALALSPDGSLLVFRSGESGQTQLFAYRMDGTGIVPIAGTEGGHTPFFSPNGQMLGFLTQRRVMMVPIGGGLPIEICVAPSLSFASPGATWGEDDAVVYAAGLDGLMIVDAANDMPEPLTEPDRDRGEQMHYGPQFLPGGRELLFMIRSDDQESYPAILSLDTRTWERIEGLSNVVGRVRYLQTGHLFYAERQGDSGSPARLRAVPFDLATRRVSGGARQLDQVYTEAAGDAAIAQFAISASGLLAFVQGEPPESQLVRVRPDEAVTPLTGELHNYSYPQVSPNGRQIVVRVAETRQIYLLNATDGRLRPLTFIGTNSAPVWNRDRDAVTFASTRAGTAGWDIFSLSVGDSPAQPELLLGRDHGQFPMAWWPSAPVLAFYELSNETARDIWTWSRSAGAVPIVAGPWNERSAAFSPNGRWLAYVSDESGVDEIYVQPYPEGRSVRKVSQGGATEPVWSPLEDRLFYRRGRELLAVNLDDDGTPGLESVVLEGPYALTPPQVGRPNYDVFPDGESFVFVRVTDVLISQVRIRVNWFDELKPSDTAR